MKTFLLLLVLSITGGARAQYFSSKNYPVNYFRNPLSIPIQLSGNFGELRTNHFHMGLDIRTNQRENLPVYAAAEGYVSRIIVERYGYGRAIVITHSNGYSTLYAHLNDFYPELNEHVKSIQYRDEKWEADFTLPPNLFPVKKGQFIAYSGNTGGSQGPHLHFEIRDTKTDNNINPLHFNFNIPDRTPPFIYSLYYYDRRNSTYQTSPVRIPIKKVKDHYEAVGDVTIKTLQLSFGVSTEDKTDKSFAFGVYQAELWVDDSLRNAFQLDNFNYTDSRYSNAAMDYKTRYSGGSYIQHLSRLPGNQSPIYYQPRDGVISLSDTSLHSALIYIKDVSGNTSSLSFRFKMDTVIAAQQASQGYKLIPNQSNIFTKENIEISFSDKAFYDTLVFEYGVAPASSSRAVSEQFALHNYRVPVHDSFTVRIKQTVPVAPALRDRIVMQLTSNKKIVASKGAWQGDWLEAKFWDLGKVQLIVDTVPPRLTAIGFKNGSNLSKAKSISFLADDDAGELKEFHATVDRKWIMFSRKDDYFIHKFDERISTGLHELNVRVTDEAGNVTERVYSFTR